MYLPGEWIILTFLMYYKWVCHQTKNSIYTDWDELHVQGNEASLAGRAGETPRLLRRGDVVSIHGQTGQVYAGRLNVTEHR